MLANKGWLHRSTKAETDSPPPLFHVSCPSIPVLRPLWHVRVFHQWLRLHTVSLSRPSMETSSNTTGSSLETGDLQAEAALADGQLERESAQSPPPALRSKLH